MIVYHKLEWKYALYNSAKLCHWNLTFTEYLTKKCVESTYYNVTLWYAVKNLIRVIYHLENSNHQYLKAT